jgi:hypothetical protein
MVSSPPLFYISCAAIVGRSPHSVHQYRGRSIMKNLLSVAAIAALLFATYENASGQWSNDSTVNTPVSVASGDQRGQQATGDGSGGIILVWEDYRGGQYGDIYAQRIDASGVVQWATNGVAICTASGYQSQPSIASDGVGGAFITWWDRRNEGPDGIYVQRINASGVVQWTSNGIIICDTQVDLPVIAYDGNGGAIVAWEDYRNLGVQNIYAQRIDGSGNTQWAFDGVPISNAAGAQQSPMIICDGVGGAIIGWPNPNAGIYKLYAQRINASGTVQWGATGTVICGAANEDLSLYPAMIPDGYGGALFAWEDDRNTTDNDIYAQRIDSTGAVRWTTDGVAICALVRNQRSAALATDGKGGAVITWRDERRSIAKSDIYVQLIDSSGVVHWGANGTPICVTANTEYLPTVLGDGAGGGIIAWQDNRTGTTTDIYAQKVDATGAAQWNSNGIAVCAAAATQENTRIVSDSSGGAIVAWDDFRAGNSFRDLYAQHIGNNSVLPVELASFSAHVRESAVELTWTTATEVNSYGFEVEKQAVSNQLSEFSGWRKIGLVAAAGTSNGTHQYSFTDQKVSSGFYAYRLKQVDKNGAFKYSNSSQVEVGAAPKEFTLGQNYPNPFNPTTTLEFTLEHNGRAVVRVYNILGQEVATLFDQEAEAGRFYQVQFSAPRLASGAYISVLEAGGKHAIRKMLLVK